MHVKLGNKRKIVEIKLHWESDVLVLILPKCNFGKTPLSDSEATFCRKGGKSDFGSNHSLAQALEQFFRPQFLHPQNGYNNTNLIQLL